MTLFQEVRKLIRYRKNKYPTLPPRVVLPDCGGPATAAALNGVAKFNKVILASLSILAYFTILEFNSNIVKLILGLTHVGAAQEPNHPCPYPFLNFFDSATASRSTRSLRGLPE